MDVFGLRKHILVLGLTLFGSLAHGGALPGETRTPCPEYESLVLYVSHETGWPIGDVCPRMIYTSAHPLAVGLNVGTAMEMETGATYYPASGAIKLSVQTDLSEVPGMALLIHQLVHAFQYDLGLHKDAKCTQSLEREAYRVQAQFLSDNGYAEEADKIARMADYRSMCPNRWMDRD